MKNTHLEHPEDIILSGKDAAQNVINFLWERNNNLSVKYDGAPAIVFGTHPVTNEFFVGTKSVFNKKKIKVNYTHSDIEKNHSNNPKVAGILHTCLEVLPRVEGIYQGDFIGFGGKTTFTPNTITYTFDNASEDFLNCSIVLVCHTTYVGNSLQEVTASFEVPEYLKHNFVRTRFINADAQFTSRRRRIDLLLNLASVVVNFIKYPTEKEVADLKIAVNKCIREGRKVDCLSGNLLLLFNLISQVKMLLMEGITVTGEQVDARIDYGNDYVSGHEGYVMTNKFGTYKLVNREVFSYNNFNLPKNW